MVISIENKKNVIGSADKPRTIEDALSQLSNEKLLGNFDDIYRLMPVTKDTSCGISFIRGSIIQK